MNSCQTEAGVEITAGWKVRLQYNFKYRATKTKLKNLRKKNRKSKLTIGFW